MLKYMLDTNIAIYILKKRPIELVDIFNKNAGALCISTITLAQLNHGVEKSSCPERNHRNVNDFISRLEVLPYDDAAASHYGEIRTDLEKKNPRSASMICISRDTREAVPLFL